MPTDWGPVVQTGIGAAAAIGGGFVGAWWQARGQLRVERDRRRERAAEVLAEVAGLLEESDMELVFRTRRATDSRDVIRTLRGRREASRVQLLTLTVGHPSREVRKLLRSLDVAIAGYMSMLSYFMVFEQVPDAPEVAKEKELAQQSYKEAQQLLAKLLDAL